MNHPQTYALTLLEKLSKERLETIYTYACCALTLMWCLGVEPDHDIDALLTVSRMIDEGVIERDCTVKWADAVRFLTGRESSVEFKNITSLEGIKERTPVRFDYKGKCHWVGVERGLIRFNPLEYSICVEKGRPATMRKLIIKGVTK